ncbi:MAG: type II secretion system protein, partial [Acidobacteriota bacterium]
MAALLVMLAIMGLMIGVAAPAWRTVVQRDNEEELIFRGRQYTRAIDLFRRKYANANPASFDLLVEQKFLRRKYKDPMSDDGEFQVLFQGAALGLPGGRAAGPSAPGSQTSGGSGTFGTTTGGQAGSGAATGMRRGAGRQQGAPIGSMGNRGPVGPQAGIIGVVSTSTEKSFRLLDGRSHYNEWLFVWAGTAG